MFTPKGKFGWYELMTSDTKAAGKFYSDVVGWTIKEMPGDGMPYTTFNLGDVGIGPDMIFSREPIRTMAELRKTQLWTWNLDDVFVATWPKLGVQVVPLTFPACSASPSCPTPRVPRLWSSLPIRRCLLPNAPHLQPPVLSVGTNSTQLTSKLDLTSTTSSLVGRRSTICQWGLWGLIASSMRAITNKWATAA